MVKKYQLEATLMGGTQLQPFQSSSMNDTDIQLKFICTNITGF